VSRTERGATNMYMFSNKYSPKETVGVENKLTSCRNIIPHFYLFYLGTVIENNSKKIYLIKCIIYILINNTWHEVVTIHRAPCERVVLPFFQHINVLRSQAIVWHRASLAYIRIPCKSIIYPNRIQEVPIVS